MNWKNLKITNKFFIAFGAIVAIMITVSYWSIRGIDGIQSNFDKVSKANHIKAILKQKHVDHLKWSMEVDKLMTDTNSGHLTIETNPNKCAFGKWYYGDERKEAEKFIPQLTQLLINIEKPHIELHKSAIDIDNTFLLSVEDARKIYNSQTIKSLEEVGSLINQMEILTEDYLLENRMIVDEASYKTRLGVIIFSIIAAIVASLLAYLLSRGIINPLNKAITFAEKLEEGDLNATIDLDQKDEIGGLANALKNLVKKLREVVGNVKVASYQIADASSELSGSSQQMSIGATEQASSVEEISSSMEEMAANIQQNTENAKETEKTAMSSAERIQESNVAVNKTVSSMETIADKISIIGEISQQTNLLALNAAVEAARAGEHGKGFAVVAGEIRKLAERSQAAATEIDEVSKSSVGIAQESGKLLSKVVPEIQQNATLIREIAEASIEQNNGTEQINSAIQQLNQVVQQNAAVSEEMASSSEELNAQADMLKDSISFFKVDSNWELRANESKKKVAKSNYNIRPEETIQDHFKGTEIKLEPVNGKAILDAEYEKF